MLENIKGVNEIFNKKLDSFLSEKSKKLKRQVGELNNEVISLLSMLSAKEKSGEDFDIDKLSHRLFKGYNGLGTSYIIFHKLSC
jgi:hypothetical protein